jgi:hypothetical protein
VLAVPREEAAGLSRVGRSVERQHRFFFMIDVVLNDASRWWTFSGRDGILPSYCFV